MKKSLIALAVLTAAGAASAQSTVTLSGKFGFAYLDKAAGTAAASTKTNGFGVTDGNVTFAAVEDLGAGMKAGASMDVRVRGRNATLGSSVDGRDATVFVSGGFGTITGGAIEAGNGLVGLGGAGAPVIGQDDTGAVVNAVKVLDNATNTDVLAYASPVFAGGFSASVMLLDSVGAPGAAGMESTNIATQDATLLGVAYTSGPIAVKADYTNFGFNSVTNAVAASSRTRVSASYDLGVAKLGFGYQTKTLKNVAAGVQVAGSADIGDKQTLLGVSAPVGASMVVGATYSRHSADNLINASVTGTELGAQYNLSKRTALQVAYQRLSQENVANDTTSTRIRLMHSF